MITIDSIHKHYKNKQALKGVDFSMNQGEIIGLVGPNGAGKSTLMRVISGINSPSSGRIIMPEKLQMSCIFDFNGLYPQLSAYENLLFFMKLKDKNAEDEQKRIEAVLSNMQLSEWKDRKVKEFSKGMLRKLTIARAIITNPNLLILDEPFDGLDIESHRFVIEFLKKWVIEGKRSILLASHNMSDVEDVCSRVIMISDGTIMKDKKIDELKNESYRHLSIRFICNYEIGRLKEVLSNFDPLIDIEIKDGMEEGEVSIYSNTQLIPKIISTLASAGFEMCEVNQVRSSLEEVYIEAVGGSYENANMERL